MRERITIREVAKQANVSPSTVSRVINGREADHMRPETKQRVVDAIEALSYTPVKAAQQLRRQRSQMLGVLVPDISNLYFALLVRGIEAEAFDRGFSTLICDSDQRLERELRYLDILLSEGVDGVLFVPTAAPDMPALQRLIDRGTRILVPDRRVADLPCVEADNLDASSELTNYVLGLGYRRIGYIAGPEGVSTADDRLAGFLRALDSLGIAPVALRRGDFTYESGYECGSEILDHDDIQAVLAGNDLMAFGVLRAAEERGLSIPGDLGVAGFDHVPHVPYATFLRPELTTVEVPVYHIGQEATRLLLKGSDENIIVPTMLIRGGTCRPMKGNTT
ncbi:LacI family DNA-binding transcriptional regulator [Candidatus Bipolaricaulota bacterium]|nr:LacI family DNA-binding transcriptional regulator [Candidatus Bipolaricaulota bacterium]